VRAAAIEFSAAVYDGEAHAAFSEPGAPEMTAHRKIPHRSTGLPIVFPGVVAGKILWKKCLILVG
jgi:hypothetical protein